MKVIVSSITEHLFKQQFEEFESQHQINLEKIILDPQNPKTPDWCEVPESDAFFLTYEFMFAVRDDKSLIPDLLSVCKKTKFVQTGLAGMDSDFAQQLLKIPNLRVANARGVHAIPIANYVFAQALRWTKRIDEHIYMQSKKNWAELGGDGELTGKTMIIWGCGGIGQEIARIAKAFGMNVVGVRRSEFTNPNVDHAITHEDVFNWLPFADFVVLALPDSSETRDIVDTHVLDQCSPQSMLINVGRGTAIDEDALAQALNSKQIACAALDTTKIEPLPKDSPLWTANNCFISAHDSAHSLQAVPRTFALFLRNLSNLLHKKTLENIC
jgi:phosphoglycerate dehydrogenase-like enzyme